MNNQQGILDFVIDIPPIEIPSLDLEIDLESVGKRLRG